MLNREKIKLILNSKLLLYISKDKTINDMDLYAGTLIHEVVPNADPVLCTMFKLYARELQQLYRMEKQFTSALKHHKPIKQRCQGQGEG